MKKEKSNLPDFQKTILRLRDYQQNFQSRPSLSEARLQEMISLNLNAVAEIRREEHAVIRTWNINIFLLILALTLGTLLQQRWFLLSYIPLIIAVSRSLRHARKNVLHRSQAWLDRVDQLYADQHAENERERQCHSQQHSQQHSTNDFPGSTIP